MKRIILVMLSGFCISCNGQNIQQKGDKKSAGEVKLVDTLSVIILRNKQYSHINYKVLRLYNLDDNGNWIDSTRRIELTKDDKIVAPILLPKSEDVTNFSVSKIVETKTGFKIVVNWGRGNYFYVRDFYFIYRDNQFYLDSVKDRSFILESQKEKSSMMQLNPPILINNFDINNFIENE